MLITFVRGGGTEVLSRLFNALASVYISQNFTVISDKVEDLEDFLTIIFLMDRYLSKYVNLVHLVRLYP